eukprot:scaffold7533_cov133-Amphora_coffeaeformis.AAC.3
MQASSTETNDPSMELIPSIKAMEEAVLQIFQALLGGDKGEETLVLLPQNEKQSRLLTARRLLRRRAIEDLHMKEEELPILREPPTVVMTGATTPNNANTGGGATFNPYVGHRYDAKSAAVGANLGPGNDYVSPTDRQLEALQRKKNKLEQQAAKKFTDREWKAWAPGETVRLAEGTTAASTAPVKSDAALLAQRAKAQQVARQQREEGGFTTAAMRQVAALKNKKVYSHVQITIQFADQSKLTGKFLPKEKISTCPRSRLVRRTAPSFVALDVKLGTRRSGTGRQGLC